VLHDAYLLLERRISLFLACLFPAGQTAIQKKSIASALVNLPCDSIPFRTTERWTLSSYGKAVARLWYTAEGVENEQANAVAGAIRRCLLRRLEDSAAGVRKAEAPAVRIASVGTRNRSAIYVCTRSGSKVGWLFKAPEAELTDSAGKKVCIIRRTTWRLSTGAKVTGKVLPSRKRQSPTHSVLCWGHGSKRRGGIRRSHEHPANPYRGWLPRVQIPAMRPRTAKSRESYSADYYFYEPKH